MISSSSSSSDSDDPPRSSLPCPSSSADPSPPSIPSSFPASPPSSPSSSSPWIPPPFLPPAGFLSSSSPSSPPPPPPALAPPPSPPHPSSIPPKKLLPFSSTPSHPRHHFSPLSSLSPLSSPPHLPSSTPVFHHPPAFPPPSLDFSSTPLPFSVSACLPDSNDPCSASPPASPPSSPSHLVLSHPALMGDLPQDTAPPNEEEKLGIRLERNISEARFKELGIRSWPKWACPPSKFPWMYDASETCYLVKGKVKVYPEGASDYVEFGAGDLAVLPKGMNCTWHVSVPLDKHYKFDH